METKTKPKLTLNQIIQDLADRSLSSGIEQGVTLSNGLRIQLQIADNSADGIQRQRVRLLVARKNAPPGAREIQIVVSSLNKAELAFPEKDPFETLPLHKGWHCRRAVWDIVRL